MANFLIIRFLDSGTLIHQRSFCLGSVEVKPSKTTSPDERKYLEASLKENNEQINFDIGTRVSIIVEDVENLEEAQAIAEPMFEEVLDVMSLDSNGLASFSLMKSGVARDLSNGKLYPILNSRDITSVMSNMFAIEADRYPQITHKEYIIAHRGIELCNRMLRSLHWSRHASWEKNLQMRILFNWFSIEALLKLDENDNVAPKVMLMMGFPLGQKIREVPDFFMQKLEAHPDYTSWKRVVTNDMEAIRNFRNNSVHSGFRLWDIEMHKLQKYSFLAQTARVSCQKFALYAISANCKTAENFWDKAPNLLVQIDNLVEFVHGTLIYSLSNQSYKWY